MGERDRKKKSRRRDYSSSSSQSRNSSYDSDSRRSDKYRRKKVKKQDKNRDRDRSSSEDTKKKDKNPQQNQFQQFGMMGMPGMQGMPGMNMGMMGMPNMMPNMNMGMMQNFNMGNMKKGMGNMMGMMGMMNPNMLNPMNMGNLANFGNMQKPPGMTPNMNPQKLIPPAQVKPQQPIQQNLLTPNPIAPVIPGQNIIQNPTIQFQQQDRFINKDVTDSEVYSTFRNRFSLPQVVEYLVSINFNSKLCNQENLLIICKQYLSELEQKSKELGNKKIQKDIQQYLEKLPQEIEKELVIQKKKLKDVNDTYLEKKRDQNRCKEEEILKQVYQGDNLVQMMSKRKLENQLVDLNPVLKLNQQSISYCADEDDQIFEQAYQLIKDKQNTKQETQEQLA